MQYEIVFKVIGCSCYTCLPQIAPAAAQTALKTVATPGTGTDAPPVAQRLLTNCNTRFIKGHIPSNHIRARIKSHVYTTE